MNFPACLKRLKELASFGIKTGTGHTRAIAVAMGSPHLKFPAVLIGGTNGKGSTSSYLESVLRSAGYRTGLFTSPHLVDIRERIKINGRMVSRRDFSEAVTAVEAAFGMLKKNGALDEAPTFFETVTLAAFHLFARMQVDIAVVEVGMGGRNDCTNILEPILSIVTNVSLDHQQYIGRTIREIAAEKAGIFRKNRPALVGKTSLKTETLLLNEASKIKPNLTLLSDFRVSRKAGGFALFRGKTRIEFPSPPLEGAHQIGNAALAALAASELEGMGFEIGKDAVFEGIRSCRWRGRLEKVSEKPDAWLDGAHNLDGIRALKKFAARVRGKKVLLFGAMKDKPVARMVKIAAPVFDKIIFTEIPMERAAKRSDFEKLLSPRAAFIKDPVEAFHKAIKDAGKSGSVIVAGSLYLVGHILERLEGRKATAWGTGL